MPCARLTSVDVTRTKCLPSICDIVLYNVHCTDELTSGNLKMAEGLNSDSESDIQTV